MALNFRLFLLVLFATYVAAADDAEFAFNLLSDIAPILALFGDQFAKQFISESHTWVDHLIFAMVPLGIITAITGAIRVQGMPTAKAFIGRARENRAQAEIELMSSTSGEVCEIFNGSSIVRAMGESKIAQFLIFPEEYDLIEKNYKPFDQGSTNRPQGNKSQDMSCGIYSLKSAFDAKLIDCAIYRSESSIFFEDKWKATKRIPRSCFQFLYAVFNRNSRAGRLKVDDTEQGRETVPADSSTPPVSRRSELPPGAQDVFQNPPNIQLNISSDYFNNRTIKKGHEIFLVVTIGLLLQTGLIAIAAVTAFRVSPSSSSIMESRVYGFPCYIGGSLLLSIGTGLCSFIVEHSTDEYSWKVHNVEEHNAPRLLWLQQRQSVNDQSFNAYIISSGPKCRVVTSSRREIPERQQKNSKSKNDMGYWEWLTVTAALSAALGFTAQFMGLRGLAFPCSIAQLGSIFIMALLRAGIRRRLGRRIEHCLAFQWYEVDFLAAQIVLYPGMRTFDGRSLDFDKRPQPDDYFGWKINTPYLRNLGNRLVVPLLPKTVTKSRAPRVADRGRQPPGYITTNGSSNGVPTSQQLLRVRKRLADLTEWKTRSSTSAIALVRSIQLVMNTFLAEPEDRSDPVTWILQATFSGSSELRDSIKFSIARKEKNSGWDLDAGLIDAAMSLWMAGIDAKRSNTGSRAKDQCESQATQQDRKQVARSWTTDWRFGKNEDTLRYRFYRIIGDNLKDGVLKRDISWWVNSLEPKESKPGQGLSKDDELIIGFNGIDPDGDMNDELGISAEAPLPMILAQHLFTSFMWTVAQCLPKDCLNPADDQAQKEVEVEGAHTFESYSFQQTWPRLRLRHHRLTELVRKIESFGMGTTHDILLCMIPALSYMRLLPNQAVLKLIPRVGPGSGWAETASCHRQLLETIQKDKINLRDTLDIGIVTAAMDFLSFACEPYGEHVELPSDLSRELSGIVKSLCSSIFAGLMEKLLPVYCRQSRQSVFENIFRRFQHLLVSDNIEESSDPPNLHQQFTESIFGFTEYHRRIFAMEAGIQTLGGLDHSQAFITNESYTFAKDIFGWTPYHYMSVNESGTLLLRELLRRSGTLKERLPKLLCAYSRSPIHLAALEGKKVNLEPMLQSLSDEMRRHVFQTSGIDGMTVLHLISKRGHISCVDSVTPKSDSLPILTNKDVWGRQALHLASKSGSQEVCSKLLELGARSDQLDGSGKSSVDYFLESKRRGNSKDDGAFTKYAEASTEPTVSKVSYLTTEESKKFFRLAMESPTCRYSHGRTFLHSAVELAHPDTIQDLLGRQFDLEAQDDDGRTPLHYAVLAGRLEMTTALINGFDVVLRGEKKHFRTNLSAGDFQGTTALMFASREKLEDIVEALLSETDRVAIDQSDGDGKTALFYAANLEMVRILVGKKCNTIAKNSIGRTRLQTAIGEEEKDIALYLLHLKDKDQIQESPFDSEGESLLITACKSGLSALVEPILERWGSLLNEGDNICDVSPLAWACEGGHKSVVEKLLTFEVDVNRAPPEWENLTALHCSVLWGNTDVVDLLLRHKHIDLGRKDTSGQSALEMAVHFSRISTARKLLLHHQTAFSERVKALKALIPTYPKRASEKVMALVSDGLKSIRDRELICEFLVWLVSDGTSSTDKEIKTMEGTTADTQEIEPTEIEPTNIQLPVTKHVEKRNEISVNANQAQGQSSVAEFLTPLVADIIQQGWDSIGDPYNLVMLLGDDELREAVKGQKLNDSGFDSDMWSCADYIKRFDRKNVMKALVDRLMQSETQRVQKPGYKKPTALTGTKYQESINFQPCNTHRSASLDSCSQLHVIEVTKASNKYSRACIRSYHCIPPSSECFYFEVEVLEDSWSGIMCIGFCGVDTGDDDYPGCFPRSWAYHGDDGNLFIETGSGEITPSDDFGFPGTFNKGDTVGAGFNMQTGEGFCTLNGKRLNMGNAFNLHDERFLFGKLYPCVGFDLSDEGIGLSFLVNLDQSADHPFKCQRPFNSD